MKAQGVAPERRFPIHDNSRTNNLTLSFVWPWSAEALGWGRGSPRRLRAAQEASRRTIDAEAIGEAVAGQSPKKQIPTYRSLVRRDLKNGSPTWTNLEPP
jgi:hypothetical protein